MFVVFLAYYPKESMVFQDNALRRINCNLKQGDTHSRKDLQSAVKKNAIYSIKIKQALILSEQLRDEYKLLLLPNISETIGSSEMELQQT